MLYYIYTANKIFIKEIYIFEKSKTNFKFF